MKRTLWLGLAALAWMLALPAAAKPHLFDDVTGPPLKLVITAPFRDLVSNDHSPKPYPATISAAEGDGAAETLAIQVEARGNTRRTADFCSFPPIRLIFDKTTAHETLFRSQHKLKLVTYCRTGSDYEQRIVLEYLAYRLYNLITPMSFRARPAEVTYRSSETDAGTTRFGFLLEEDKDVAGRNDKDRLEAQTHQISSGQLDPHATARAALFEFMISNLDWEFLAASKGEKCCHNTVLLAQADATPPTAVGVIPLPYDFDFSGLVDAPYALPPVGIPVENTTDRYYRGYCITTPEMASVIAEYQAKRADMMALIDGEPHLNPQFRAKADRFLASFFDLLDDPGRVQSQIVKHCR